MCLGVLTMLAGCAGGGDDGGGDDTGPMLDPMLVLDDLEDGDGAIEEVNGRIGAWFTYNDGTAKTQVPDPDKDFVAGEGGAHGSKFAAITTGSGYTKWGSGMGFDINNTGEGGPSNEGEKKGWDASSYTGIRFLAKGNVPLRVGVLVTAAVDKSEGGTCVAPTDAPKEGEDPIECGDSHGRSIILTGDWKEYKLEFSTLKQDGWGVKADFDAKTVTSVMFDIAEKADFNVAVDDLGFF